MNEYKKPFINRIKTLYKIREKRIVKVKKNFKDKIKRLNDQLEAKTKEYKRLEEINTNLHKNLSDVQHQSDEYYKIIHKLHHKLNESHTKIKQLIESVNELSSQLTSHKKNLDQHSTKVSSFMDHATSVNQYYNWNYGKQITWFIFSAFFFLVEVMLIITIGSFDFTRNYINRRNRNKEIMKIKLQEEQKRKIYENLLKNQQLQQSDDETNGNNTKIGNIFSTINNVITQRRFKPLESINRAISKPLELVRGKPNSPRIVEPDNSTILTSKPASLKKSLTEEIIDLHTVKSKFRSKLARSMGDINQELLKENETPTIFDPIIGSSSSSNINSLDKPERLNALNGDSSELKVKRVAEPTHRPTNTSSSPPHGLLIPPKLINSASFDDRLLITRSIRERVPNKIDSAEEEETSSSTTLYYSSEGNLDSSTTSCYGASTKPNNALESSDKESDVVVQQNTVDQTEIDEKDKDKDIERPNSTTTIITTASVEDDPDVDKEPTKDDVEYTVIQYNSDDDSDDDNDQVGVDGEYQADINIIESADTEHLNHDSTEEVMILEAELNYESDDNTEPQVIEEDNLHKEEYDVVTSSELNSDSVTVDHSVSTESTVPSTDTPSIPSPPKPTISMTPVEPAPPPTHSPTSSRQEHSPSKPMYAPPSYLTDDQINAKVPIPPESIISRNLIQKLRRKKEDLYRFVELFDTDVSTKIQNFKLRDNNNNNTETEDNENEEVEKNGNNNNINAEDKQSQSSSSSDQFKYHLRATNYIPILNSSTASSPTTTNTTT
eukprot:TRINITY_DN1684_c2_g1_i1.p1 TRINITY_DN1684_c2_g1~~TRINITY_DN1684_c2_g1_i1.p1  ORF type:complete len:780 (+),score=265.96 TRINITY_DN1684_c2_g1_i1:695-3034(+)